MNWPRISPETNGELSAGKLGSRIGVDISNLWFVFRRPSSTPARPPAQAAKRLKRLKALNERGRGALPDFMTQEDLRKMREDRKWDV